jgi:hypothetical protein
MSDSLDPFGGHTHGTQTWGNRIAGSPFALPSSRDFSNGEVNVTVLSDLQVALASAPAVIQCYVSWEDMQFMGAPVKTTPLNDRACVVPGHDTIAFTPFVSQSSEAPPEEELTATVSVMQDAEKLSLLYGGESVVSLRSLMQRTTFYKAFGAYNTTSSTNDKQWVYWYLARFPVPWGCQGVGTYDKMYEDVGGTLTNGKLFNCQNTIPLSLFTSCFAGYRGSIVWRGMMLGDNGAQTCDNLLMIQRARAAQSSMRVAKMIPTNSARIPGILRSLVGSILGGGAVTSSFTNASANVSVPMLQSVVCFQRIL